MGDIKGMNASIEFWFSVLFWVLHRLLDLSNNTLQGPCRALLADLTGMLSLFCTITRPLMYSDFPPAASPLLLYTLNALMGVCYPFFLHHHWPPFRTLTSPLLQPHCFSTPSLPLIVYSHCPPSASPLPPFFTLTAPALHPHFSTTLSLPPFPYPHLSPAATPLLLRPCDIPGAGSLTCHIGLDTCICCLPCNRGAWKEQKRNGKGSTLSMRTAVALHPAGKV